MKLIDYYISTPSDIDALKSKLSQCFASLKETAEQTTVDIYDTFDWRLHHHGWQLLRHADTYTIIHAATGRRISDISVDGKKARQFSWDFPASDFTDKLGPVIEMRALIPLATIEKTAEDLRSLIPEARVAVAHGQMPPGELDDIMNAFYDGGYDVLVCTTIIETGIDVPSANTIIIERADKFGLAHLHQLRGRVGRSHHQAYAYLLTPPPKSITADAKKRLDAISEAQDLGAGFMLATHDLEIRGAGELLGEEQSGQIESIGFTLYMQLLDEAVKAIREGRTPNADLPLSHGTEMNLRIPALIPEDYLPDVHNRLMLYKRIASVDSPEALKELQVEMIDRFGLLPDPAKNLIRQTELRLRAEALGIVKVDAGKEWARLEFGSSTPVDPLVLVKKVQSAPDQYRLEGANSFRFRLKDATTGGKLDGISRMLGELEPAKSDASGS